MIYSPGTRRHLSHGAPCLRLVLVLLLPLGTSAIPGAAQNRRGLPASAQGLHAVSLSDAIRAAATSRDIAIAVGAEKVQPLTGVRAPESGVPLIRTVINYGYIARRFGAVLAIAPKNMAVLNHSLLSADIYKDIPPAEAFAILAAALDDAQRTAMLSERGLGVNDLTTPTQRGLFLTLFPSRRLKIIPRRIPGHPQAGADRQQDIPNPMQTARLRIGTTVRMAVYSAGSDTPGFVPVFGSETGPRVYDAVDQTHLFSADAVDGATVRSSEPNVLKKGQLDYDLAGLQRQIRLDGPTTVGDIIARIVSETKIELYADRHYERRSVLISSPSRTLKASDLLQSLCLCITGAFRRVGSAYVLTDDIYGVGARRQKIVDFQADGDAQRAPPLKRAEDTLQSSGVLWRVRPSSFGDPLSPTPGQMENEDKNNLGAGAIAVIRLQFEQLTRAQQQALQHYAEEVARLHNEHPNDGYPAGVDFDRDIELNVEPSVQLLIPGLDGAIDTGLGPFVSEAFRDMSQFRRQRGANPKIESAVSTSEPSLAALTQGISRRALLANAKTLQELENTVATMRRLGLNQLWLPVFSDGIAALAGTPFSSQDPQAVDLLAHALKITAGSGIAVYPVLDLFAWGDTVPRDAEDLTITGHTSVQDSERRYKRAILRAAASGGSPPGRASRRVSVSPLASSVSRNLSALIAALSNGPGLAGIVWRETCPSGYDLPEMVRHIDPSGRLGYTEVARLAFLRKYHSDPIDITPQRRVHQIFERAETTLPGFDDENLDRLLDRQWNTYCTQTNVTLLNILYNVAAGRDITPNKTTGVKKLVRVVFVREHRDNFDTTWYGAWAGPNTTLPTNHISFDDGPTRADLQPAAGAEQQARAQSSINLIRLPTGRSLDEHLLEQQWADVLKDLAKNRRWDGFVFEMDALP